MAMRGEEYIFYYTLTDEEGNILASSTAEDPSSVLSGYSLIHPAVEKHLSKMVEGEERKFILEAQEAYGAYDKKKIKSFKRSKIQTQGSLKLGKRLGVRRWWGDFVPGKVISMDDTKVTIDFNHEYADMRLHYHLHLLEKRDTSVPFACGIKPGKDEL